ncbi:WD repeat-containing protein 26-like isoform X1 [Iris pallida]|uniref:WD repeat-containing protein 26-like isoform X1 n=1 Tax=Iris pallida TaxID=29817 RepID=A0AAX6DY16_IRIPA|nr:WD repeat-containing protein 26-like isoform X1 [Iris pallida]
MGSLDEIPSPKRLKVSSAESERLSNDSFLLALSSPSGDPMASHLPSQEKEDIIGPKGIIRRTELVRTIASALYSLGYEKTGRTLEEESKLYLRSSMANLFRKQVLDGNWNESVTTLHELDLVDENVLKDASFRIFEHKFFELLEKNRTVDALNTLRTEITPLTINKKRVHELSGCLVFSSQHALQEAQHPGIGTANSRLKLLEKLQKLLPTTFMIPEGRLECLVEQALILQRDGCKFHNPLDNTLSLYTDHQCRKDQIPSRTIQILQAHHGEVWFLQFSNHGKYLASSSSDKSAVIWEVHEDGHLSQKHTLSGHENAVAMVAWSPDDQQLLSCGAEEVVRRWDVTSGKCLHVYEKSGIGLSSCGWFPDGDKVFSGAMDKSMYVWDLDGKELGYQQGQGTTNTSDMAVTKDGKRIISMFEEAVVLLHDTETKIDKLITEEQTITSFSLSRDDKFLLLNLVNQEIHLWDITDDPKLVMAFRGHKRVRFVIRSCLGGSEQGFIASGSEDSQVYIWCRRSGDLVHTLPGHSGAVNCVSWNPVNPLMLASASDDRTIRIWGSNKPSLKRKDIFRNGDLRHCNGNSIGH